MRAAKAAVNIALLIFSPFLILPFGLAVILMDWREGGGDFVTGRSYLWE